MKPGVIQDVHGRPLRNLRVSVTDRCNLRCAYCMPEPDYVWLPRDDVLRFEEIETLVDIFLDLGVDKVRLTGGEPLLRRDLPVLVRALAERGQVRDLALTTNGVLLADHAQALKDAGLHRSRSASTRCSMIASAASRGSTSSIASSRASTPPRLSSAASRSTPSSSAASTRTSSWT